MAEYIPCVLVRETSSTTVVWKIGKGVTGYASRERIIPCEMSDMVALMQGKKKLLPGPWKVENLPDWATAKINELNQSLKKDEDRSVYDQYYS